jgi:glycosyltransferase involved in cell wall biosynthesis
MKIILTSNTSWSIYNFRRGLIVYLIQKGWDVHIIAPQDKYTISLEDMGCSFHNIEIDSKSLNPFKSLILIWKYLSLFKKIGPNIILFFTIKCVIFGNIAARMKSIKAISTIAGLGSSFISKSWVTYVVKWLYRLSLKDNYKVFFLNPDDYEAFDNNKLVKAGQMVSVPGEGLDVKYFQYDPHLPTNPTVFLLIARMIYDKGVGEYIEAAKNITSRFSNVQFHLIGPIDIDNPTAISKDDIDIWTKAGIVEYLGETTDIRPFIKTSTCIVLPSYREGLPYTLMEASAIGRPIIATNVPGCREVVESDITGFLCKKKDVESLIIAMEKIINMSEKELKYMGEMGCHRVKKFFDETPIIQQYYLRINQALDLND